MALLEINGVKKTYGGYHAVNEVSFHIEEKKIFGLLGPNGAGKTTLIRMITHILTPDKGEILLSGERVNEHTTEVIGYMPEERGLYKKMKVGEQLMYLARLKGLSKSDAKGRIDFWLDKFDIKDWWSKKIEELSKGMQQKVQFISTVMHEPSLIILDEPFSGLDPINSNLIKNEIYELSQKGTTIIFSTHRMEQVEEICEEIVLMNKGQKILQGEVADLKQQFKHHEFEIEYYGDITNLPDNAKVLESKPGKLRLQLLNNMPSNDLLKWFINNGTSILSFREILPSLNEIFIEQVEGQSHE